MKRASEQRSAGVNFAARAVAAAASSSVESPGLRHRRRRLFSEGKSDEPLSAFAGSSSAALPSSFQAAVAACLREAEEVLQFSGRSCAFGVGGGPGGTPRSVVSSQASAGPFARQGRGVQRSGQKDPSEDRATLLTAVDLWRRLYRTIATAVRKPLS